jgi:transcriptional antiterminator RfaH
MVKKSEEMAGLETWRVLQTRRYKERTAEVCLTHQGLRTYLPLLGQWPRPAFGSKIGPMFPGYLFVWAAPREFPRVGSTPGVRSLVAFGGVPGWLDEAVVDFLRAREGADGVIRPNRPLARTEVVITDDPLRGLAAVVERRLTARQRVLVLLDILQRQTRVEAPENCVRQV